MDPKRHNIAIFIYPDAEVLDFSGPFEVFSTADRLYKRDHPESDGIFNPFLVAETNQTVTARAGYRVEPHYSFSDHPAIDILIVVGGVHTSELEKPAVIEWIRAQHTGTERTASVCTGAFLLGKAGLLNGHPATTHWEDIPDLRSQFPTINVLEDKSWVESGKLITSGGISAGIDMSLHLVSEFTSMEFAERTARQMEYNWTKRV
jgi:transcriptional regulator GlxA family with amidase domain